MQAKHKGILWFVLQCFTVSVTLAVVRFAIRDINIFVMVFLQSSFSLMLISPVIYAKGISYLKTRRPFLHITRTVCGLIGTSCFFYGVTKIPLNDATAISFTGPLFTTIAAILILREKARRYRIIGLCIGFAGALIVIRPVGAFDANVVYIIITVILMGFVQVMLSMLNKTEPPQRMLFYMIFLSWLFTMPLAIYNWVTPGWDNIAWIFCLSLLTYINVYSVIRAYKFTEIGTLMPLDFTRLIFTSLVAYFAFGESLSAVTVLGSVVILAGIVYVISHERKSDHKALDIPGEVIV